MIRRLIDIDWFLVRGLLLMLHAESTVFGVHPVDTEYVRHNFEAMICNDRAIMLGAFDTTGLQGVMLGAVGPQWYSPRLEAYEMLLAVFPEWRGSSVAYRLVREFERESERLGAEAITVGTSLGIADASAVKLYNHLGYSHAGTGLTKRIIKHV